MFERMTKEARQVLVSAQDDSRSMGHGYIGTEHLILGLLLQPGRPVTSLLAGVGIDRESFRSAVEARVGRGSPPDDAAALRAIGIDLDQVRATVERSFGPGALDSARGRRRRGRCPGIPVVGGPPFTPRAKKALELALREALRLGHRWIGPEHILLGILREGEGLAVEIMADRGASLPDVRRRVMAVLDQVA